MDSPQPPGLTDEQRARFALDYPDSREDSRDFDRLCDAVFAAGCEAQRKVDAEIARWHVQCAKKVGGLDDEDVRECAKEITEAIERTPEKPTTKRCGTCGSDDPATKIPLSLMGGEMWCEDGFHSQPTTGEAK